MTYDRGTFVLCLFPNSDLQTYKKRPALIVQDTSVDTGFPQVIVALVTTSQAVQQTKTRVPVDVKTRLGQRTGLIQNSMIVLDNLATIPTKGIQKKLGVCGLLDEVEKALSVVFGMPPKPT